MSEGTLRFRFDPAESSVFRPWNFGVCTNLVRGNENIALGTACEDKQSESANVGESALDETGVVSHEVNEQSSSTHTDVLLAKVDGESCAVCLDVEDGELRTSDCCGRLFHKGCLQEWVKRRIQQHYPTTCPTCRAELPTEFVEEMRDKSLQARPYHYTRINVEISYDWLNRRFFPITDRFSWSDDLVLPW